MTPQDEIINLAENIAKAFIIKVKSGKAKSVQTYMQMEHLLRQIEIMREKESTNEND